MQDTICGTMSHNIPIHSVHTVKTNVAHDNFKVDLLVKFYIHVHKYITCLFFRTQHNLLFRWIFSRASIINLFVDFCVRCSIKIRLHVGFFFTRNKISKYQASGVLSDLHTKMLLSYATQHFAQDLFNKWVFFL